MYIEDFTYLAIATKYAKNLQTHFYSCFRMKIKKKVLSRFKFTFLPDALVFGIKYKVVIELKILISSANEKNWYIYTYPGIQHYLVSVSDAARIAH